MVTGAPQKLTLKSVPHCEHGSDFDWWNIECGQDRVGKVRGIVVDKRLTIYSIQIFPEFERKGYAKKIVEIFKSEFNTIVADRVRPSAKGFWKYLGFDSADNGNYIWNPVKD